MTDVLMPALSPTMESGTLAKWMVKPGDVVKSGDVIAEIETDKATMEVEAVDEGVVDAILVPEGTEEVKVNTPIARLKGEGEASEASAPPPARAVPPATPAPKAEAAASAPNGGAQASAASAKPQADASAAAPQRTAGANRVFASPLARRLAKEAGIDLAGVTGSGPHGRIIRRDLDGVKPGAAPAPAAGAPQPAATHEAPREARSLEQIASRPGATT